MGKELLNTGLFNMEEARSSAGWRIELEKGEHAPETEEYEYPAQFFEPRTCRFIQSDLVQC